jgi:GNAT superfamily N-acetyltransferase
VTPRFATRSDLPAIATFLPALGGSGLPERFPGQTLADYLHWKYFQGPLGEAVVGITVDAEQVVGLVAATPRTLCVDGTAHAVFELGDFLTDERYRGRGIFSRLIEAVCEELKRRHAKLAYVRPNENSFPILVRHGSFTEARQLDVRRFVFPSAFLARRFSRPASWFGKAGPDWAALRWALGTPRGPVQVRRFERFGPQHDRLWHVAGTGYRVAIGRHSEYLNWRYAQSPTPFLLWEACRGEETVGFLSAFASPSSATGHIADLFTGREDADACVALLAACFHALRDAGVRSIYCWKLRGEVPSAAGRALSRACPLATGRPHHLVLRVLDPSLPGLPPSGWHLSMGDFDGL